MPSSRRSRRPSTSSGAILKWMPLTCRLRRSPRALRTPRPAENGEYGKTSFLRRSGGPSGKRETRERERRGGWGGGDATSAARCGAGPSCRRRRRRPRCGPLGLTRPCSLGGRLRAPPSAPPSSHLSFPLLFLPHPCPPPSRPLPCPLLRSPNATSKATRAFAWASGKHVRMLSFLFCPDRLRLSARRGAGETPRWLSKCRSAPTTRPRRSWPGPWAQDRRNVVHRQGPIQAP